MKQIDARDLATVSGGSNHKNTQLTQALTQIQSSVKDLSSSNNGNTSNNLMLPMMLMMMNRPSPTTVVAAPAPAAGPVVNVSTRRW